MIDLKQQILIFIINSLVFLYTVSLITFFIFSLVQLNLLFNYLTNKNITNNHSKWNFNSKSVIPYVTVQLPVYNEFYVIKGLLNSIEKIKYPKEKIELQVLDDSNDESSKLIEQITKKMKRKGINIHHIRRNNREGFKAGALKEGLKKAKGEFILFLDDDSFIFDENILKSVIEIAEKSKVQVFIVNNQYELADPRGSRLCPCWGA